MKLLIASALISIVFSPLALANTKTAYFDDYGHSRKVLKAKVIRSTPRFKYVTINQPQRYCKPAVVTKTYYPIHDNSAVIIGSMIGGAIGHAASDKQHKGFLVGAVVGGSVMHNIDRANHSDSQRYQVQQPSCLTTYSKTQKVRVLDGYKVTYRLRGKTYQTVMQDKPTKYIRFYN